MGIERAIVVGEGGMFKLISLPWLIIHTMSEYIFFFLISIFN